MRNLLAGAACVCVLGCATVHPIDGSLVAAEAPYRAAEEMGAARIPEAALHLNYARDEMELAKKLASQGDQRRADLMTARAQLDAELALALAKKANITAETKKAIEQSLPPASN